MKNRVKTTTDFHKERVSQGQRVGVINLGCARNLVDSQTLLTNMKRQGHTIVDVEHVLESWLDQNRCDAVLLRPDWQPFGLYRGNDTHYDAVRADLAGALSSFQ